MKWTKNICLAGVIFWFLSGTGVAEESAYVGQEVCKECHEAQYKNFTAYSRKARSFDSIKKMEKNLTPEEYQTCFECHTTGYGKTGGFVSEEKTPGLKNTGCEVCHGPGRRHAESQDPDDIIAKVETEKCLVCHNSDRVGDFNFKPLMFGGAH